MNINMNVNVFVLLLIWETDCSTLKGTLITPVKHMQSGWSKVKSINKWPSFCKGGTVQLKITSREQQNPKVKMKMVADSG